MSVHVPVPVKLPVGAHPTACNGISEHFCCTNSILRVAAQCASERDACVALPAQHHSTALWSDLWLPGN